MLSNVRIAIECSLLLSLLNVHCCRVHRQSRGMSGDAYCNDWNQLRRLTSGKEFSNSIINSQCKAGVTLSNMFFFIYLLFFFILRLCMLLCRTSSCTTSKWIDNPSFTWQLVIRQFCESNDGGIVVCFEFRCSLVKRAVLLCEYKRSAMEEVLSNALECSRLLSNVWGRIAQRLRSYAKFDIWSGVVEFSSPLISYLHKGQVAYRSSCSFWVEFARCFH